MRFITTLAIALLLTALLVVAVHAQGELRLVAVSYAGWEQLQQLASLGLQIVNYQGDVLAALCSDAHIEQLRRLGFQLRVLDAQPDTDLMSYYLAYPAPGDDVGQWPPVEALYLYDKDVYIVKATATQVESLARKGIQLAKLPAAVVINRVLPDVYQPAGKLTHRWSIRAMVEAVSPTWLIQHVCKLQDDDCLDYCNEQGTRYSYASDKLNEAAQYLYRNYKALGLRVTYEPFLHNSTVMTNVVAELPGLGPASDHIYILCAHYDSTSNDPYRIAPGADDNASGSAAVLEAARVLSRYSFSHTLRFIHFAGEEQGLLGSAYYAAQATQRGDVIVGVINLDMIAYESVPPNDHIVEIHAGTNPASIALADVFINQITKYGLLLHPEKITNGATGRSDHASFWNHGYPAILGIEDFQDFNPYYHSTNDTLSRLQTQLMVEFTKACVATLAELASVLPRPLPKNMLQ
ncbi:MAG: Zn-dependent exopeptidase M28 [Chloroflexi bacterium]|nr:Zn-dependent exopeptidase M28 [Chloroflexota bacterium]